MRTAVNTDLIMASLPLRLRKNYISIEGNVGCGKTSVLELLRETQPSLCCIGEPVHLFESYNEHNPLTLSYLYPTENAAMAQHHFIACSTRHYQRKLYDLVAHPEYEAAVSERSVISPLIFITAHYDSGVFSKFTADYLASEIVRKSFGESLWPNYVIYLDLPIEECRRRVLKRGREGEVEGCTLDYLDKLEKIYHSTIDNLNELDKICAIYLPVDPEETTRSVANRVIQVLRDLNKADSEKTFTVMNLKDIEEQSSE